MNIPKFSGTSLIHVGRLTSDQQEAFKKEFLKLPTTDDHIIFNNEVFIAACEPADDSKYKALAAKYNAPLLYERYRGNVITDILTMLVPRLMDCSPPGFDGPRETVTRLVNNLFRFFEDVSPSSANSGHNQSNPSPKTTPSDR